MNTQTQKGFIHITSGILLVVILFAIGGTYFLVSSQAKQIGNDPGSYADSEKQIYRTPGGSRKRILQVARQQLNYSESPTNKVKFFEWAGDKPGAPGPWCSVFATWTWHAAGVRDESGQPYPMRPGVYYVWKDGKDHNRVKRSKPKMGDAIIYGNFDHIGIIEKVRGNKITVIEGNAGLKNQQDKYVVRRTINLARPNTIPYGKVIAFVAPPQRR